MDEEFIECLKDCDTYEDVVELVDRVIEDEIEISKSNNQLNYIGYNSLVDNRKVFLEEPKKFEIDYNCGWNGFIDDSIRITFGGHFNLSNGSGKYSEYYYYMDTRDFIYDFCYEYKDYDFDSEYDLLCCVKLSMDEYFRSITNLDVVSREQMILPFIGIDNNISIENHRFSSFKGKNNAMCSEKAAFANNLLSVYGVGTAMSLGRVIVNGKAEGHVFNFVDVGDTLYLVDFSYDDNLYNFSNTWVGKIPFTYDMKEDKNRLEELANTSEPIYCRSTYNVLYDDGVHSYPVNYERVYTIGDLVNVKEYEKPKILLKS